MALADTTGQAGGRGAARRPAPRPVRPLWSLTGLAVGLVFACASLTPTLLPLSWFLQGVATGLSALSGYGVGVGLAWLVRQVRRYALGRHTRRGGQPGTRALTVRLLLIAGVPLLAGFVVAGSAWQREGYRMIGAGEPSRLRYAGVLPVAIVIGWALLTLVRALRRGLEAIDRQISRWVRWRPASLVASVAAPIVIVGVLYGPVDTVLTAALNAVFRASDGGTNPGVARPTGVGRSGGPGSLVSWDSLGREGRDFVAQATTAPELRRFTGTQPRRSPIRVYVGMRSSPDVHLRAALAVRELERAGAFQRAVLTVVTTTGSGWVDPRAVAALELAYGGDTATVAMQYSYLPSWMAFLDDRQAAEEAGRELFDQVYREWVHRPAGERPRLLVFGESLGAFGAEAAFHDVGEVRTRTDGVLLEGPVNSSPRWQELVRNRDPGSTAVLPVVDSGRVIRFAVRPEDLSRPPGPWEHPRVVYLQHGSDPVVWWSPDLLLQRPDWLAEPPAPDRPPGMHWFPVVSFWQTTAALAFSTHVPPGYGHNYGTESVDAWMAIAPPEGWSPRLTERLRVAVTDSIRLRAGPKWLT
jgi:uncharacterized membrane protein